MAKVLERQSIFDIAMQYFGSADAALNVAIVNGLSITDFMPQEVMDVSVLNKKIVDYYRINKITPATEVENELTFDGIDYWIIEDDFIVQ